MRWRWFWGGFIGASLFIVGCGYVAGSPRVDTSSEARLQESIRDIEAKLSTEDKLKFDLALAKAALEKHSLNGYTGKEAIEWSERK